MPKTATLATAPTLDAIAAAVARFYCGEAKRLEPQLAGHWSVVSPASGKTLPGVRVVAKGKRYVFEMT